MHMTFASKSLLILFFTQLQCLMAIGYGLCEIGSEIPVSISILVKHVIPILVSSCTNWDLNVSNNLSSDCFISWERLCKGGLKVVQLNVFIHHFLCNDTVNRCL